MKFSLIYVVLNGAVECRLFLQPNVDNQFTRWRRVAISCVVIGNIRKSRTRMDEGDADVQHKHVQCLFREGFPCYQELTRLYPYIYGRGEQLWLFFFFLAEYAKHEWSFSITCDLVLLHDLPFNEVISLLCRYKFMWLLYIELMPLFWHIGRFLVFSNCRFMENSLFRNGLRIGDSIVSVWFNIYIN